MREKEKRRIMNEVKIIIEWNIIEQMTEKYISSRN